MRSAGAKFLLRFCLVYGVLVVPWPFVQAMYARGFVTIANATYPAFFRGGSVEFERLEEPRGSYDLSLQLRNARTGAGKRALVSSRQPAFYQLILLVALVVATPFSRRQWLVLILGLGALHVIIFTQFLVMLVSGFARPELGLVELSQAAQQALGALYRIVLRDIVAMLMVPIFVWLGLLLVFDCAWFEIGDETSPDARSGEGRRQRRAPKLFRRIRRRSQAWP